MAKEQANTEKKVQDDTKTEKASTCSRWIASGLPSTRKRTSQNVPSQPGSQNVQSSSTIDSRTSAGAAKK
jgi:hypothetical protein